MKQPGNQNNPWIRRAWPGLQTSITKQPDNQNTPWLRATENETVAVTELETASGTETEPVTTKDEEAESLAVTSDSIVTVGAVSPAMAAVEAVSLAAIATEPEQKIATGPDSEHRITADHVAAHSTPVYSSTIFRAMEEAPEPFISPENLRQDVQEDVQEAPHDAIDYSAQPPSNPFGATRVRQAPPAATGRGQRTIVLMAVATGVTLLALGVTGGWWWAQHKGMLAAAPAAEQPAAAADQREVLYWYDPMMPQQHFDKPGPSPFMDMDLVPMYAGDAGAAGEVAGVKIDSTVTQNLGVRLATAARVPLSSEVEATGVVGFNERDVAVVQTRTGGFVERVWPLAPGDLIRAGQPLVELTVPEWAAAEYELLSLKATGDIPLIAAARDRLRLLGMPEEMIAKAERDGIVQTRYTVTAPVAGLVQSLDVRTGMTLMTGQDVARLNGLSKVWLEAAVPEASAGLVRVGNSARVQLAGFHDGSIEGRVTAILPTLNESSRSLRVRIELPNRDGRLRPGLTAQVTLKGGESGTALAVPTEAVIRTGKRTLVMVAQEQGRYAPVAVTLGREMGDKTVITSGLSEGQEVVASGQFLIDSEASLKGIEARSISEDGKLGMPLMLNRLPAGSEGSGP